MRSFLVCFGFLFLFWLFCSLKKYYFEHFFTCLLVVLNKKLPSEGWNDVIFGNMGIWYCQNLINSLYKVISSVQSLSRVWLVASPWTAARRASLSITNSWSLIKLMSIEVVMPSNHLILCRPLLLLPSIFPSIKVFSNESTLRMRWPKYWSFSFSISPSKLAAVHKSSQEFSRYCPKGIR